jgi:putative addiction module component (TIGR02574 family)
MAETPRMDLATLTALALALPRDQQMELADRIWINIGPIEDEELFAEIERREVEIESGAVQTIPHEQVMREVREMLDKRRGT